MAQLPEATEEVVVTVELQPPEPRPELTPALLTIKQAARMLGVGRSTLYGLIANGRLEVVHIGRRTLVPIDAIAVLVARLRAERTVSARS